MDERFGVREALRALSQRPERAWPAGAIHHGARVLLLLCLALVVQTAFPVAPVPDFPVLEKGMVADRDLIAQVGFPIYKSEAELTRERAEAAVGVAPIFDYDPGAVDTMLARVEGFLTQVAGGAAAGEGAVDAELRRLLQAHGLPPTDGIGRVLRNPRRRAQLQRALVAAIRTELPVGIVSAHDLEESSTAQLRLRRGGRERLLSRDSLRLASHFFERGARHVPRAVEPEFIELHRLILIRFFEPSIRLNREATDAARERARQAVPTFKGEVLKGEKIVGAHEQVRDAEIERLQSYREELARLGNAGEGPARARSLGALLYSLSVLAIFGVLLFFFRPAVYHDFRQTLLVALLILCVVGAAALVAGIGWPVELIPIAFPALVIAMLWDGRMALTLSLVLAVLLGGQAPLLGISVLYTLAMGGAAAALGARGVWRRSQTLVFIAIIAAAYVLAALALGLLRSREASEVLSSAIWGVVNAVVSGVFAMQLLPLFEAFTRITTDQTLQELSDMRHALLQRLQREAPGTFQHSLAVANLAEVAARTIGANALLARVGSYYHDIGKLSKPQYFIENQPPGRNPHDKLKPAMSAAIVRNHVVEGTRLAAEAKLPECVQAFIAEHHGTQSISFFYDRAQELDPDAEVDPRDFSYPGPRPRSKETAVVMLADSVESAARALVDPTADRIRALVERIVDNKIAQRQLDDAPITLGELSRIKEQLVLGLSGIYHQRIDYPSMREEPEAAAAAPAGRG